MLDSLVSGETPTEDTHRGTVSTDERVEPLAKDEGEKSEDATLPVDDTKEAKVLSEKPVTTSDSRKITFRISSVPIFSAVSFRRIRNWIRESLRPSRALTKEKENDQDCSPTYATLLRMATTRRMVTSLTRLLSSKSEVVAQIRKRLLTSSSMGVWDLKGPSDDVSIYMGDVHGTNHCFSL